jgi:hypothetical protein
MDTPPKPPALRHRAMRLCLRCVTAAVVVALVVVVLAEPAHAATLADPPSPQGPPTSLFEVISRLRSFLVGLLVALATLFLTVAGVRYLVADGDPGEIERAKKAFRSALLGYGIAVLAPIVISILQGLVG